MNEALHTDETWCWCPNVCICTLCILCVCVWLYIYMYLFVSTMIGTYLVSCCLVLLIVRLGDPLTTVNVIASVLLLLFSIITDIVSFANETAVILPGYYVQSWNFVSVKLTEIFKKQPAIWLSSKHLQGIEGFPEISIISASGIRRDIWKGGRSCQVDWSVTGVSESCVPSGYLT